MPKRLSSILILSLTLWLLSGCLGQEAQQPSPTTVTQQTSEPVLSPTVTAGAFEVSATPTAVPSVVTQAAYPEPASAELAQQATPYPAPQDQTFIPLVSADKPATPTPEPPTLTPTPSPTPIPTLDFATLRTELESQGQALATNKIGFHIGVGGNRNGLGEWMQRLDEAGVPFFLKTVSDAGPLVEAQNMIRDSGVPHTLVFRHSGDEYDTPRYDLPPAEAARLHWDLHMAVWPPELDPSLVWLETTNEIDKNVSEWMAQFSIATANIALAEGFKWSAFGWASGEPEPEMWESAAMLEFLRLVAAHPDRLAISLHEYSYDTRNIADQYPFKVGRFQQLFSVCDQYGIPRPTVLISEWGWEYTNNPPLEQALADIIWASELYAPYPEIKGAAIWYLGPSFADIAEQTQKLIYPVMVYSLTNYIPIEQGTAPITPEQYQP